MLQRHLARRNSTAEHERRAVQADVPGKHVDRQRG